LCAPVPPIPGAKDKRSDKPKTSRPKAKKPKTSESPQTSAVTPSPTQGNESCDDGWDLSKSRLKVYYFYLQV
jgi:hypothetical protein